MQDEDKSNGASEEMPPVPMGELLEVDISGLEEVEVKRDFGNPAFLLLFLSLLAFAVAVCLPTIIQSSRKEAVRIPSGDSHPVIEENRQAQENLRQTLDEIESALQNPQSE